MPPGRWLLVLATAVMLAACGPARAPFHSTDLTGSTLGGGFQLTDHNGTPRGLADFRGKVVMLQFTASWCGVCRKEMPFIEKDIWQKHKSDPDFMLMGIDRDEPLNKVIAFGKSTGVTYPLGLDPGADIFAKYALRQAGITRNVLIDKEGRIVMLTRLYNPEEFSALVKKIDELLK